jgi:hypothetical protein
MITCSGNHLRGVPDHSFIIRQEASINPRQLICPYLFEAHRKQRLSYFKSTIGNPQVPKEDRRQVSLRQYPQQKIINIDQQSAKTADEHQGHDQH